MADILYYREMFTDSCRIVCQGICHENDYAIDPFSKIDSLTVKPNIGVERKPHQITPSYRVIKFGNMDNKSGE